MIISYYFKIFVKKIIFITSNTSFSVSLQAVDCVKKLPFMMVLQESLVQTVLTKTILMTCGKTLSYNEQFSVEGSLQITVDKNEIILIEVKDTVLKWDLDNLPDVKEEIAEIHLPNKQSKEKKSKKPAMSKKRKRKCKTQRENKSDCGPDDNNFENIIFSTEDYPTETDSQISKFPEEGSHLPLLSNIESEVPREGDVGFGGVVIKEEEPFLNNDTSQELVALVDGQPAVDVAQPANLLSGQVDEIASDMVSNKVNYTMLHHVKVDEK